MSTATRRTLLFTVLLLMPLAVACVSGCVAIPGLPAAEPSPTPQVCPTPAATARPVPSSPNFIPMEKTATPIPTATPEPTPDVIFNPTYRWEYKNVQWAFTMVIPEDAYKFFKNKPRTDGMSYADYALADEDRETLRDVAERIKGGGESQGYSDYDNAMNVLTFVQSLPYARDTDTVGVAEYPRYPVETLKDGTGDCEDKTILAAALLQSMGMDVVILMMPDHSAVGINVPGADGVCYEHEGKRYYYCETTSGNWKIGEQPDDLQSLSARVVPMKRAPVLGLHVTATSISADGDNVYFRTQYTVENAGPGAATNVVLRIRALAPDRGENEMWPPEQTMELHSIAEGETAGGEITVTVPQGELGQIECVLTGDNFNVKKVRTDVFRAVM